MPSSVPGPVHAGQNLILSPKIPRKGCRERRTYKISRAKLYTLRRRHLDEVFGRVNGGILYLWRADDHESEVPEVFANKLRDCKAALDLLKQAMKSHGRQATIVTDRLQSYRAVTKVIGNAAAQTYSLWLKNGGKLTLALSKTGGGDGTFRRHQDPAEIRLHPCPDPQPFQAPTSPQPP